MPSPLFNGPPPPAPAPAVILRCWGSGASSGTCGDMAPPITAPRRLPSLHAALQRLYFLLGLGPKSFHVVDQKLGLVEGLRTGSVSRGTAQGPVLPGGAWGCGCIWGIWNVGMSRPSPSSHPTPHCPPPGIGRTPRPQSRGALVPDPPVEATS